MDEELSTCYFLKALIICRMVEVAVGIDDIKAAQFIVCKRDEDLVRIASGIDHDGFSCPLTTEDVTIGLNWSDNQSSYDQ